MVSSQMEIFVADYIDLMKEIKDFIVKVQLNNAVLKETIDDLVKICGQLVDLSLYLQPQQGNDLIICEEELERCIAELKKIEVF